MADPGKPGSMTRLCPTCLHDGVLEKTLERARAAEAKLAALDAMLPSGSQLPLTPELIATLVALWDAFWNKTGTLESDTTPGYSLISYDDVNTLDEAAEAVEALLYPPSAGGGEGGSADG